VNNTDLTDRIIAQGRALMHAIETVGTTTIEPSGPFERALVGLLMVAYQRPLRGIVGGGCTRLGE
jgi:hypothetical protein